MKLRCPNCNARGLSVIGTLFMVHDERVICGQCNVGLTVPKSRKSLIIGIEYVLILASVAASIALRKMWPSVVIFIFIAIFRLILIPRMAVVQKRVLNRLRKYRKK